MAIRLEHTGNATPTTLTASITSTTTTLNMAASTGWPTGTVGPFVATLDGGTASEEKILVLSRTGNVLTVQTRGYDGTAQTAHGANAAVEHTFSATEADEANATAVALGTLPPSAILVTTTGVQTLTNKTLTAPVISGASGSVVTTAATQTLTAKTLTAPVVTNPTVTTGTFTSPTLTTPVGVPWGTLTGGYAQTTANQTGITVSADLTGLTVTVTVAAGRRIRITGYAGFTSSGGAQLLGLSIFEDATRLNVDQANVNSGGVWWGKPLAVLTPSAGSHTYKLQATGSSFTFDVGASATQPNFILVEDIGV